MTFFYFLLSLAAFICGVILVLALCRSAAQADKEIQRMVDKVARFKTRIDHAHKS